MRPCPLNMDAANHNRKTHSNPAVLKGRRGESEHAIPLNITAIPSQAAVDIKPPSNHSQAQMKAVASLLRIALKRR